MKALLTTRCGCSRMIDMADGPRGEVLVPMFPRRFGASAGEPNFPQFSTRRFRFDGFTKTLINETVARYKEEDE